MKKQIMFAIAATLMMTGFAQAEETHVNPNDPNCNLSIPKEQPQLGGKGCPFAKAPPGNFSDIAKVQKDEKPTKSLRKSSGDTVQ
jgi:hypothetical protein